MKRKFLKKIALIVSLMVVGQSVYTFAKSSRFNEVEKSTLNENIDLDKLALWYDEPATNWENEALPIGNGYMGGMIFGSVASERIQYNEKTLWSGGPGAWEGYNGGNKEGAWEAVQEIRKILAEGGTPSNDLYQRVCGDQRAYGAYQNFGDIFLDFKSHEESKITNYRRELNIEESLSTVKYNYKGVNYEREYFCSYPDNVMVIKLKADKASSLTVDVRNEGAHNGKNLSVENNTLILSGAIEDNGMKYESQIKVINTGGSIQDKEDRISVENADEITIIMSAGTDYINEYPTYKGEDPHSAVTERINNAVNLGYDELKSRHIEDYKNLFDRVNLNLGELKLDKPTDEMLNEYKTNQSNSLETLFFQYGRYLLISSSREGSLPANLQGVWNNSNNPPWSSDYHFNVNIQMNYWPAEVANLSETAIPLVEYVESLREPGRKTAEMHCGIEGAMENKNGWTVNTMNNPFGFTAMGWEFDWGWAPTSNAWISQNLWEHYQFTEDKDYLRENIYPIMKEAAQFWTQFLVEYTHSDGKTYLVSSPSYSPEHGPRTVGTTFDQELIWQLFTDTIKASETLGIDEEFRAELEDKRERLLTPQIGKHGQVQEWKDDIDDPNNNHRHISHLVGLYPGTQINQKDTPELYEAAKVTMNHRGDGGTGWSKANKINLWARLLDGDRAHRLLENQLTTSTLENLFDTHPPFQIDGNMGAVSGMAEMLVQSHLGTINPLPALPTAWEDGSFDGLKARGNFEISANWNNNSLNLLKIKSGSGNDCYLEYPGITEAIITDANGNKITPEVVSENVVKFQTEVNGEYKVEGMPMEKPEKVNGLKALRNGDNSVSLKWNKTKFAECYDVYRKGKGDFELIAEDVKTEEFIDENAPSNDSYSYLYYVVAKNSEGLGEASEKVAVETSVYLSELEWKSASTGYGEIQKDASCDGNTITLKGENGEKVSYDKGIGTHAHSEIVYSLEGLDYYDYFETFVGVDQEMAGTVASISFEVYLDHEKVFDSGLMTGDTKQKHVKVPIAGKNTLKLVVKDGGDSIGSDHGSFGDAKLTKVHAASNADLKSLNINGNPLEEFNGSKYEYSYDLKRGENLQNLNIEAEAFTSEAKIEITKPEELPGEAVVRVTSKDETMHKEYRVLIKPYVIVEESIIAYYNFENSSNLGEDSSKNSFHGEVNGTVTQGDSKDGKAANFGDGYIRVESNDSLKLDDNIVIETEVYLDEYTNYWQKIAQKINNGTGKGGFLIDVSPQGKLRFHAEGSITQFISNKAIPLNEWTNIKVIFEHSKGEASIYINGELDKTVKPSSPLEVSDLPLIIGADSNGNDKLKGKMNNLTISSIERRVASSNASLSDISINGETMEGFKKDVFDYEIDLEEGTNIVPEITATSEDSNATIEIKNTEILPGVSKIKVIAEDGTESIYTINLNIKVKNPLKADFNKNGEIDLGDLSMVSKYFGSNNSDFDLDGDGLVGEYEINFVSSELLK
ncbi:glycoside hydrolase N-terminal domain-containing protein [Clostridium perfringens]|uniref:Glycosyl hydrolase family 98 putative carbohydrate-binding module domain-containing protein n=1 Tax=Clostridium perfringens TaxID=1502 RepID=A0AAW9KK98_CLOPF|nr:glycoside hydrolase N-terminal domain-containing protein [Clostridium perfringens]MBI6000421.1 glycoside hydrolase N-terminal domain-containing protein [Clostridium perfringens]MBI6003250.1 glycoside hydrolase N-terminal domain-containing protein [Clostridium perfringens]MBI6061747.1 glycoside hydrolase N-terminal domain-containing protein [Clostridium perfringens]MBI6071386.1 glycoside hydrolase N-terminal domain-containing protein [Clostridium perfringens]MBI6074222.1 glycoside hydrolase 